MKDLNKLKPTINSLIDQTVRVDQISVNVSPDAGATPAWLKNAVTVSKMGIERGKMGAIIPTLRREGEKDTRIIVVDDNVVYGRDFIEKIIKSSDKNSGKAVYTQNRSLNGVKVIETRYGAVVKPEFFRAKDVMSPEDSAEVDL
jgi:choline kinase